jgi:hypothetical protein
MPSFPRNIFHVWFQGCKSVTKPEFVENMKAWATLNPTWNYQCVSDKELREACRQISHKCLSVYESLPFMHMKIDFGRYVLMYVYGGVYVDMDAYALRGLEYSEHIRRALQIYERQNKHVIAVSESELGTFDTYISKVYYNNAFMLSSAGNPLTKLFIEYIMEQCKAFAHSSTDAMVAINKTTGPKVFSTFFRLPANLSGGLSEVIVIPSAAMEVCDWNRVCRPTDQTIALHQNELSWISSNTKGIVSIYNRIRNNIILLIIIVILLFLLWVRRKKRSCR